MKNMKRQRKSEVFAILLVIAISFSFIVYYIPVMRSQGLARNARETVDCLLNSGQSCSSSSRSIQAVLTTSRGCEEFLTTYVFPITMNVLGTSITVNGQQVKNNGGELDFYQRQAFCGSQNNDSAQYRVVIHVPTEIDAATRAIASLHGYK